MHKLLLTLATLSSGVLCNAEQNLPDTVNLSLDQMKILNSRESNATADSLSSIVNMTGNFNYHAAQQVFFLNGLSDMLRMAMKGCVSHVQRDDYVVTVGIGAHKLNKRKVKWDEARKACMAEGGQLAILNSVKEEKMLVDWMNRENVDTTWLGVHDQFTEGDWVTLTGESIDTTGYNTWNAMWPNQPDNFGGNQNCGSLLKQGGMDDTNCNINLPYFCKINLC